MVILVDADGVLENLTVEMLALINERHGTNVTIEDIKEWNLTKALPVSYVEELYHCFAQADDKRRRAD